MKQNYGSHTEIRMYLSREAAAEEGAYNVQTKTYPPDFWGTSMVLYEGTVKVRNADGKIIS